MTLARKIAALTAGAVLVAAAAGGAQAHHSGAMYDRTLTKTVSGTVKEFNWTNPHSSFSVETSTPGEPAQLWYFEMNGPQNLVHEGWKRTTLTPGDKVTVIYNPLRDGRPGGWYVSITLADGHVLGGAPQQ